MINPRYLLLLKDYQLRDKLTLILFGISAGIVLAWGIKNKIAKHYRLINPLFIGCIISIEIILIILTGIIGRAVQP